MMKIVLASRNRKKIAEMRTLLSEQGGPFSELTVLSLDDIGFTDEIEETGTTFEENALLKAAVPAEYGYIGIADDSGLAVDALDGAPGVYSARYAGEPCDDEKNNQKLLAELAEVAAKERTGRYVCAIACVFPDGRRFVVQGSCEGRILSAYQGDGGFGYDPLFYVEQFGKTFAEVTLEEKNSISHRGKAVRAFARRFSDFLLPARELTSKQRAKLRALANSIQPIFQIGKSGVTEEICRQLANALEAREIIKVSVLEACPYAAREAAEAVAFATGATVVSVTGRRFVLYRESAEKKKIEL